MATPLFLISPWYLVWMRCSIIPPMLIVFILSNTRCVIVDVTLLALKHRRLLPNEHSAKQLRRHGNSGHFCHRTTATKQHRPFLPSPPLSLSLSACVPLCLVLSSRNAFWRTSKKSLSPRHSGRQSLQWQHNSTVLTDGISRGRSFRTLWGSNVVCLLLYRRSLYK